MAKTTTKPRAKTKKTVKKAAAPKRVSTKTTLGFKFQLSATLLHKLTIGGNVVLAGLVVALMSPAVFPINLSYLTKDALLSTDSTVFVPAERLQWDVDLRWILVGLLAFGAVYSLVLLTRWSKSYDKAQTGRVWLWRWVYLALSTAVAVEIVAILTGIFDMFTLKLLGALTGAGYALAWLSERQNEKARRPVISAFALGLVSVLIPWTIIGGHALATTIYGLERLPWFVYAAQASVGLGVILTFVNLAMSNARHKSFTSYAVVERNYLTLALLSQVALAVVLIVGLSK